MLDPELQEAFFVSTLEMALPGHLPNLDQILVTQAQRDQMRETISKVAAARAKQQLEDAKKDAIRYQAEQERRKALRAAQQKRAYEKRKAAAPKSEPKPGGRTDLSGMTPEEKAAHERQRDAERLRRWRESKKNPQPELTQEQDEAELLALMKRLQGE